MKYLARITLAAGLAAAVFLLTPSSAAAELVAARPVPPDGESLVQLEQVFEHYQLYRLDLSAAERAAAAGRLEVRFGELRWSLVLVPNDLRAPEYRSVLITDAGPVESPRTPSGTFAGRLEGDPSSDVRLLATEELFQGYVRAADGWYFVDPLRKLVPGADPSLVVVFRDDDVRPEATGVCGSEHLHQVAGRLLADPTGRQELELPGRSVAQPEACAPQLRRLDVATEADYEYYQDYGSSANSQIQGVLNQVDGIYQGELNLTLRLVYQSVWTSYGDPYSSTTDAGDLLDEFRAYWNSNRGDVDRDVAHLFTGRDLAGTTIGIAWTGVTCSNQSYGYGLSQDYSLMAKLVAHEIGHNLDAEHDNEVSPPAASCYGTGPIMCSSIQPYGPDEFSSRSQSDIAAHDGCLYNLGPKANFYYTNGPYSGQVNFDASPSSTSTGTITSYSWDFGDGTTGSGKTVTHYYATDDLYLVRLTVTTSTGRCHTISRGISTCYPYRICPL